MWCGGDRLAIETLRARRCSRSPAAEEFSDTVGEMRLPLPDTSAARQAAALALSALAVLPSAGCSTSRPEAAPTPTASAQLPAEIELACGKPGTRVEVVSREGFIPHGACDLTGVVLSHDGVSVTVPARGAGEESPTISVTRTASGDVSFRLTDSHEHY